MAQAATIALFNSTILTRASRDAARKLNPATLIRNPVIFVTEVVAALTTVLLARDLVMGIGHILFDLSLFYDSGLVHSQTRRHPTADEVFNRIQTPKAQALSTAEGP